MAEAHYRKGKAQAFPFFLARTNLAAASPDMNLITTGRVCYHGPNFSSRDVP